MFFYISLTFSVVSDGSLDNISTHSQYDRIHPVRQLSCLIIRQGLDEENEKRTPFQGGVKRTVPLTTFTGTSVILKAYSHLNALKIS